MIRFEFDPNKNTVNLEKHGIDFSEAKKLWKDPNIVEIPARTEDEPRFLVIGKINENYWLAVITFRKKAIRIISERRLRKEEIVLYESKKF